MDYRVLTEAERKYTFSQSQQLSMQTGLIGYLRADFGSNGNEFWTTWNDFRKDLKTDEFKAEFDDVINGLRDGDVLSGRKAMSSYCYSTPDSSFNDDRIVAKNDSFMDFVKACAQTVIDRKSTRLNSSHT